MAHYAPADVALLDSFPQPHPPPTYVYELSFRKDDRGTGPYWSEWVKSDIFFRKEDCRVEAFAQYLEADYNNRAIRVRILQVNIRYIDQMSNLIPGVDP